MSAADTRLSTDREAMREKVAKAMWERGHDEPWSEAHYSPEARQIYWDEAGAAVEAMLSIAQAAPTPDLRQACEHLIAAMEGLRPLPLVLDAMAKGLIDDARRALDAPQSADPAYAPLPPGHVAVPQAALDWLFGEAADETGQWFGYGLRPSNKPYWWRSKFRSMIPALSSTDHDTGCQSGDFGPCDCSLPSPDRSTP